MTLEQLEKALSDAEKAEAEARGAYATYMKRLQTEYGCNTVAEAEAQLKEMDAKIAAREQLLSSKIQEFTVKYEQFTS